MLKESNYNQSFKQFANWELKNEFYLVTLDT